MKIISDDRTQINTVVAEIEASAEDFKEAVQNVYLRKRESIKIFGFKKGKAPRKLIEFLYGRQVFYEDAIKEIVVQAADELKLEVVEVPKLEVPGFSEKSGVNLKVEYTVKPKVKILGYKGIKVEITDSDAEKDDALDDMIATRLAEMLEGEIPEAMYEHRVADMLWEWEERNKGNVTLQDYLKYTGLSEDQFRESFREAAEVQVKFRLALEKIVELEEIDVTQEEIEEHYKEISEKREMDIEKVKAGIGAGQLSNDIAVQKAFTMVKEYANLSANNPTAPHSIRQRLVQARHLAIVCGNQIKKERKTMTVFDELKARGLLAQLTDEEEIKELINNGKAVFYIGFDPTADSLHVGHFMALCLMKRLQMAGNKPIALIGGGTAMIGDPSGRTDMRNMMTTETIDHNCECFKKQMSKFIEFGEGKAMMVNNADWLRDLNYIEFIRDIGAHFSVNRMLTAECYKQRMEKGLSFLEFNYMIMQSYDFLSLYERYGCNMQFGGDDQWSNMLGGTELIRRKLGKDAYAMTITLLLNSEGKKMGKTQKGAVWLDPEKTSPFEFYQYWRNVGDKDVLKCLRMLTFLPLEQIDEMDKWEGSQLNEAKEILAYELTKMIHGQDEAEKAKESARALFAGGNADGNPVDMPTAQLTEEDFTDGQIDILGVLVKAGLTQSRSEARRAVEQGGVTVDSQKVTDIKTVYTPEQFAGEGVIVKRGKKNFKRVVTN